MHPMLLIVARIHDHEDEGARREELERILKRPPADIGLPHHQQAAAENREKTQSDHDAQTASHQRKSLGIVEFRRRRLPGTPKIPGALRGEQSRQELT